MQIFDVTVHFLKHRKSFILFTFVFSSGLFYILMNEIHFKSCSNLCQCFLKGTTRKEFLIIIHSLFNMPKTDNNLKVQYVKVLGMTRSSLQTCKLVAFLR